MACLECERNQLEGAAVAYRWGEATVLLSGCPMHLKEMTETLTSTQIAKNLEVVYQ